MHTVKPMYRTGIIEILEPIISVLIFQVNLYAKKVGHAYVHTEYFLKYFTWAHMWKFKNTKFANDGVEWDTVIVDSRVGR